MAVEVKICGLNSPESVDAAVEGGARYTGFVFYPPSPRNLTPEQAGPLVKRVPETVTRVGLFVDPTDSVLERTLAKVALDLIQLHGSESPARVVQIKARFERPVMKAIKLASAADLAAAEAYRGIADRLIFDTLPPPDMAGALPGGNALAFDWRLLGAAEIATPWMLAGGLTAENLAEAIKTSRATAVDVSSGVEDRPGVKSPGKIRAFLEAAYRL
jgi:phosphoribosylanthranilate isomerase